MKRRLTRRRALATVGGLLTAAAGCTSRFAGPRRVWTVSAARGGFGWDVALTDERALVGAPSADGGVGTAWVVPVDGGERTALAPPAEPRGFGRAVAVDGERALVGAPATTDPSAAGTAHVFERDGGQWSWCERLTAPDATPGDAVGWDVALSGDRALVGARGTDARGTDAGGAHVYGRTDNGWSHRARLVPAGAEPYDYAGGSVALAGRQALLGSLLADGPATDAGSATLFEGGSWSERATLTAPDGAAGDRFGNAVALTDGAALVGAVGRGGGPDAAADAGAAYGFERTDDGWHHAATLPAAAADAAFGVAVALDEDRALVGASGADGGGRAVLVGRTGGAWSRRATLTGDGGGFGSSVALAGDRALVGDTGAGAVTLFEL